MRSFFLGFFILLVFQVNAQVSDDTYLNYYKSSKVVFTGVLKSKYQLPYATECSDELRMLLEYELTEIQKGSRHYKILIESTDSTQKLNHEYLVFAQKIKIKDEKKFVPLYTEEVCLNCPNPGIKSVYQIIFKGLFKTIKEPLTPGNLMPKGCGCH